MLPTDYQNFIALSRYARWRDDLGRRETWEETVERYFDFLKFHLKSGFTLGREMKKKLAAAKEAVLALEIMPSMRCLMTAGEALEKDNVAGYNCSYVAIDNPRVFDEILYILMCGTGVGFSVESSAVGLLPEVPGQIYPSNTEIVVEDSKLGWASAYRELLALLWSGKEPKWNLTKLRPAGARLKTFGGRASGAKALEQLFNFTTETFKRACGGRLSSIACHDLVCSIADIVIVGGVRRSALISLSDLNDDLMRKAKSGEWWKEHPYRALANNSAVYDGTPDIGVFMREWRSLYESRSGERGIFNRRAATQQVERIGRRDSKFMFGTNPCSEIILRSKEFCNLSEVVVRVGDGYKELSRKVKLATLLGTLQSTLTKFRFLSGKWKRNTEEERLLGVSLTGIMDNPDVEFMDLVKLKNVAVETNQELAKELGIGQSTAVTCVKPSGTVSQLVDSASGIHPRFAEYYVRTVRADVKDPVAMLMQAQGVPNEPDVTKPGNTVVFSFPQKAPASGLTRGDVSCLDQLDVWMKFNQNWCEHKPSVTVYVKDREWLDIAAYVYRYFNCMSGISFLPYSDHIYKQAPYQEIDKVEYDRRVVEMPKIDWEQLTKYEQDDMTTGTQELACIGGVCEVI